MKKIFYIILVLLGFVSSALIAWYLVVMFSAPNKVISQTYKVGDQVIFKEDGSSVTKNFIDINLYDNVFEIKFNYMLDESRTDFYSQGLQYVLKDGKTEFNLDGSYSRVLNDVSKESSYYSKGESEYSGFMTWVRTDKYDQIWGDKVYSNVDKYNYMSGDDYNTPLISTNPIGNDTFFKIQLGNDLYGMKFRGLNINLEDKFYIGSTKYLYDSSTYVLWSNFIYNLERNYFASDIDYFSTILFDSIASSVKAGTNQILTFEFGDLFDYYLYDEKTGQYSDDKVSPDKFAKISSDIKSYYSIGVSVHDGDMISSDQSLFNCYKGNSNFNIDNSLSDYFIGRNLVFVDVDKFDFVETNKTGVYYLSLNEDFRTFYRDYKHLVELEIVIDLDYIDSLGIEFKGVIKDSLSGFKIYNDYTIQNVNGLIVKGGIDYV